jgi:hypothetical protein
MKVRFKPADNGNACIGSIELPTVIPGKVVAAAVGDDKADALKKAAVIAERIASDPVMQALLPPQALPAIRAARALATAAQAGSAPLRSLWARLRGPGKRRLAKALHTEAVGYEDELAGGNWIPSSWAGQEGPEDIELGAFPLFAAVAAKYGPAAARKLQKAYKARKRKQAAKRAAMRAKKAREAEPEPEDMEPEPEGAEEQTEQTDNGEG